MSRERKAEFFELMKRYCALGSQLPDSFRGADASTIADARLILQEMAKTQAAMDELVEAEERRGGEASAVTK